MQKSWSCSGGEVRSAKQEFTRVPSAGIRSRARQQFIKFEGRKDIGGPFNLQVKKLRLREAD